jgi:hypothetical protein
MQKLPVRVAVYLREHFEDALIRDVSVKESIAGTVNYEVGLECQDVFYLLEFNEKGELIKFESRHIYDQE